MKYLRWPVWYWALAVMPLVGVIPSVIQGELRAIDDLMRFVQVRDLIQGDGWFDTGQPRFISPEGGDVHWSRLPDLILVGLHWLARPFVDLDTALRVVAAIWPPALLLILFSIVGRLIGRFSLHPAALIIGFLALTFSFVITHFVPGRIDHHNFVLTLALGSALCAFGKGLWSAIFAGILAAMTLSVALEGLPMVAGLVLAMGLFWIGDPHNQAARLGRFGLALGLSAGVLYVLDAPGVGERRDVVDAFGTVHLFALAMGGGVLFALSRSARLNAGAWPVRLVAGAAGGLAVLVLTYVLFPSVFASPYADIPQSVRTGWLNEVREARSMRADFSQYGLQAVSRHGFPFAVLLAGAYWAIRSPRADQLKRVALVGLLFIAFAATVWQVRSLHYAHALAAVLAGLIGSEALQGWLKTRGVSRLLAAASLLAVLSPMSWLWVGAVSGPSSPPRMVTECLSAKAYAPFAELAPLRVLAPIGIGPGILAATPHSVYSAPYHRNISGIALSLETLGAQPEVARGKIHAMGAQAVAYCRGFGEGRLYTREDGDSLGELLESGTPPDWLVAIGEPAGAVAFYKVVP